MSHSKFEDNLSIINKSSQQFQMFLTQFKPKYQRNQKTHNRPQQNIQSHQFLQKSKSPKRNELPSFSQEDLYENRSEFKHQSQKMESSGQVSEGSRHFQIRKPYKLNSSPPAKFSQEDNIKNQHPGQLIILKSAQQLPPWLFEHIRKKNAGKLKNICLKEDQQRHSQFIQSSERQSEEYNNFGRTRSKMAQRYLNQSYVARKQKGQLNPQNSRYQGKYFKNQQNNASNQTDYFRKVSSSSEMIQYPKKGRHQNVKKPQRNQQIYINDYEYSYCPDPETQQKRRSFKSANHKSAVFEQEYSKKMHSAKKPNRNQYKIRQEEKVHKMSPVSKTPAKRLPTVSQEEPLVEPKKFVLY